MALLIFVSPGGGGEGGYWHTSLSKVSGIGIRFFVVFAQFCCLAWGMVLCAGLGQGGPPER